MVDYDRLFAALDSASDRWKPATELQSAFDRVIVLADARPLVRRDMSGTSLRVGGRLHRLLVSRREEPDDGRRRARLHWRAGAFDSDELYRRFMLQSLHGQTKDALAKNRAGAWEYDIALPRVEVQHDRHPGGPRPRAAAPLPASLARRRAIVERYERNLGECDVELLLRHYGEDFQSRAGISCSCALTGKSSAFRNALIERMADDGVATNVHYKPLPFSPRTATSASPSPTSRNALAQFENEVTLPLRTLLSDEDVDYVAGSFKARPGRTPRRKASADVREFRKTRVRHRRRAGGAAPSCC